MDQCHTGTNTLALDLQSLWLTTDATDAGGLSGLFGDKNDEVDLKMKSGLCGVLTGPPQMSMAKNDIKHLGHTVHVFFNDPMLIQMWERDSYVTGLDDDCDGVNIPAEDIEELQASLELLEATTQEDEPPPFITLFLPMTCKGGDIFQDALRRAGFLGDVLANHVFCIENLFAGAGMLGAKKVAAMFTMVKTIGTCFQATAEVGRFVSKCVLKHEGVKHDFDTMVEVTKKVNDVFGFCLGDLPMHDAKYWVKVKVRKATTRQQKICVEPETQEVIKDACDDEASCHEGFCKTPQEVVMDKPWPAGPAKDPDAPIKKIMATTCQDDLLAYIKQGSDSIMGKCAKAVLDQAEDADPAARRRRRHRRRR